MRRMNAKEQRRENAYKIINHIRSSEEGMARNRLAELTGLSMPSVSQIILYWKGFGLLEEHEGYGQNRKAIPYYRFVDQRYALIGISIVKKEVVGLVTDLSGEVLARKKLSIEEFRVHLVERLFGFIQDLVDDISRQKRCLLSIGMGLPGLMDSRTGKIWFVSDLGALDTGVPKEALEERFGVRVFIRQNSTLISYAEKLKGEGHDLSDFIFVKMGRGIVASLIQHHRVLSGNLPIIGEIGHCSVDVDGPLCSCGNRGCLEMFAKESVVREGLARCSGEQEREDFLWRVASYTSMAVGNAVALVGIGNIIFGGELFDAYPELYRMISEELPRRVLPRRSQSLMIRRSSLDDYAVPLGAALFVAELSLVNQNKIFFRDLGDDLPMKMDSLL